MFLMCLFQILLNILLLVYFLHIVYTLFDQRSENRNRVLARVPIQLLRISLHALHCDEQLKKYKKVKSILFGTVVPKKIIYTYSVKIGKYYKSFGGRNTLATFKF